MFRKYNKKTKDYGLRTKVFLKNKKRNALGYSSSCQALAFSSESFEHFVYAIVSVIKF